MIADILVYGLALYGFAVICVKLIQRFSWWYKPIGKQLHLLILLHNAESYLERLYRSLLAMSKTMGRPLCITFVDCTSQDSTLRMLELLTKEDQCVRIIREQPLDVQVSQLLPHLHQEMIVLDLRLANADPFM